MPMKQECLDKVGLVMGRKVTAAEGQDILNRFTGALSKLSRTDPDFASMSYDQRRLKASEMVANDIREAGARKAVQMKLQVLKQNEMLRKKAALAINRDLHAYKGIGKILNDINVLASGVRNQYISQMLDTLNGIGSKYFGFVENADDVADFYREAYGIDSKNTRVKKAWKAWEETSEAMRQRAANAGADIGKLDYGYIPQSHDSRRLLNAAKTLGMEGTDNMVAWVSYIAPKLDRSRYLDEYGNPLSDDDFHQVLISAYNDIITHGSPDSDILTIAQKLPEHFASMKKFPSRALHFKDAESAIEYESKFGNNTLTGSLMAHINKMAQNIAILEEMGPKPQATYNLLKDVAAQEQANASGSMGWKERWFGEYSERQGFTRVKIDALWNVLTGEANSVDIGAEGVASFFQGWRNLEVAGKLGKAFITSFSDIPTYFAASGFNKMPFLDSLNFYMKAYGKDWKEYATLNGIIADSLANDYCRWGSDHIGQGWTAKMANATLKVSFLNAFTDATRRAFSINMMHCLGKLLDKNWSQLDSFTRSRLEKGNITEKDWAIFQLAGTEEYKGLNFLSLRTLQNIDTTMLPPNITLDDVARAPSKLLGYIVSESEMASMAPDLTMKAEANRGEKKGTFGGEMFRSLFLFKSFPFTFMRKHYERLMDLKENGSRADLLQYSAWVLTGTTLFGALSLQVQNILNGKDTQDMSDGKFWLHAAQKGGGLGFFGDILYNGMNGDNSLKQRMSWFDLLGPVASTGLEGWDIATSTFNNAVYDKDVKVGAKALKLARSHMPFMNLWYGSLALDRYVMDDIQEMLSPGYMARMESRAMKGTGQGFWWRPMETAPSRAPKMADSPK